MSARDPMLDAIDCQTCGKDFLPKRPEQKTCSPKCAGAMGAAKRTYKRTKKQKAAKVRW